MPRERGEHGIDVVVRVVEMKRDAQARVALGDDDVVRGERVDERGSVGRADADERAARRRGRARAELVEAGEEALDEPADVLGDRRHPGLCDQAHAGDPGVDVRHGRRPASKRRALGCGR